MPQPTRSSREKPVDAPQLGRGEGLTISSRQEVDCTERNEAHEVLEELVVSGCDPSEVFDLVEEPFDRVAFFVELPVAGMRSGAVGPRRYDGCRTRLQDRVMKVFGIVGAIRDHCAAGNTFDQRRAKQPFAAMTWAGDQADGVVEAVGGRVELGSQPAFRPAKTLGIRPPFSFRAPLAC